VVFEGEIRATSPSLDWTFSGTPLGAQAPLPPTAFCFKYHPASHNWFLKAALLL